MAEVASSSAAFLPQLEITDNECPEEFRLLLNSEDRYVTHTDARSIGLTELPVTLVLTQAAVYELGVPVDMVKQDSSEDESLIKVLRRVPYSTVIKVAGGVRQRTRLTASYVDAALPEAQRHAVAEESAAAWGTAGLRLDQVLQRQTYEFESVVQRDEWVLSLQLAARDWWQWYCEDRYIPKPEVFQGSWLLTVIDTATRTASPALFVLSTHRLYRVAVSAGTLEPADTVTWAVPIAQVREIVKYRQDSAAFAIELDKAKQYHAPELLVCLASSVVSERHGILTAVAEAVERKSGRLLRPSQGTVGPPTTAA